ncbi:MAG: alpha/beta fold hydrolase [Candidatus Saccharimonadales bacterium]
MSLAEIPRNENFELEEPHCAAILDSIQHPRDDEGVFDYSEAMVMQQGETRLFHGVARLCGVGVKYTYEQSRNITDPVPLGFVNGYGGVKSSYRDVRHHSALAGKSAFTLQPVRSMSLKNTIEMRHLVHPELLPSMAVWAVMKAISAEHGIEEYDLSGHSLGGFIATNVAEHKPENVRSLILVASAGLERHNLRTMAKRGPGFIRHGLIPSLPHLRKQLDTKSVIKQEANYMLRNPVRTIGEGFAAGRCNITRQVKHVGMMGIKTAALQFASDRLFLLDEVASQSASAVDIFSVFADPDAGHMAPILDPEAVVKAQLELLRDLHG